MRLLININRPESSALIAALVLLTGSVMAIGPANAERIENQVAVFAALDKVTARIQKLEVPLNQTIEFGALKLTPRVCYSRAATERPKTTSFVEVTETELDGSEKPLFTGWMFAESPGLNAVEHPVFDVWLTECASPTSASAAAAAAAGAARPTVEGEEPQSPPEDNFPRRRIRR